MRPVINMTTDTIKYLQIFITTKTRCPIFQTKIASDKIYTKKDSPLLN